MRGLLAVPLLGPFGLFLGGSPAAERPTPERSAPAAPSYVRDVAPILNRACVSCHRPGEVGPFSLVGFDNARKRAPMIATVTGAGRMPPFLARHGYGEFRHDPRLSADEKRTLSTWAAAGAPRGKGAEPKLPRFPAAGAWPLGAPDLVLTPDRDFVLGPDGDDVYRNFVFRNDSKETRWVRGIDVRPGNRPIVHHVIAFLDKSQRGRKLEAAVKDGLPGYLSEGGGVGLMPSGALGGWAPGMGPQPTDDGTAFEWKPGEDVILQVHYSHSGKEERDRTKLALYLADKAPERKLDLYWQMDWIDIPAGKPDYRKRSEFRVPTDVTLHSTLPHMHLLGRTMRAWIETPEGKEEPLIAVDDWNFDWQLNYRFREPIRVRAGSKIVVEALYDNSVANPRNPHSPPKRVTFGERTVDEMFLLVTTYSRD